MKGEFIMKTNMINTNSVIKSIFAFVLLMGMSVSTWGTAATLPIHYRFTGGKGSLPTGVTHSGLGENFADSHSPFRLKFDTDGDYIQLETDAPAQQITFGVKKISGNSTSYFQLQGCATENGSYGNIENFTVSGSTNAILYFTTSVTINSSYRFFRFVFDKGSDNVGFGVLTVTKGNTSAYTVTYNAEGGSCETSSKSETKANEGVILPDVTPSDAARDANWKFYGWAADAVGSVTTTAPTIVGKAGEKYYPSSNITLHAVFTKGEYTKITSTSEITSGEKYLIAGWYQDKVHVMTSTYVHTDDYYMREKIVSEMSSGKIHAASIEASWRYTITGTTNAYFIQDVVNATNNYIDTYNLDWYNKSKTDSHAYTITFSNGTCSICNAYGSYPYLVLFAAGDFGTVGSSWAGMMLYKETLVPKYCSNPSVVKLIASPAAGGTVVFDSNSKNEMDFNTDDGLDDAAITATPNSGYEFVNWVSSDVDVAVVDDDDEATTTVTATESAIITANFYQNHNLTYTLTGVDGDPSNPTAISKEEMNGFVAGFDIKAHYKNMTLTSVTMGGVALTEGAAADYEWEEDDGTAMLTIHHDNIDGDIVITVSATHMEYTKYAFSCAELTLTPKLVTASTPIFITSTASKQVRSQDSILIVGSGLTPSASLTFPGLSETKFSVKSRKGGDFTIKADGTIDTVAYIFYTPDAEDTSDGLDKLTGITASVGGVKPKQVSLTQEIIGRHLPAEFVIAVKRNNKWYALPDTMTVTGTPKPMEIAVDNINNPSIAYTSADTKYSLEGPASGNISSGVGQYVKLVMTSLWSDDSDHSKGRAPLFGSATKTAKIGKSSNAIATNPLSAGYWWQLIQKNTSITNPQDAKYQIYCANNDTTLSLKENAGNPIWGLYKRGIDELRLIPASDIVFTEAYFVEWAQHGGVIEVDAQGVTATSVVAHLGEATSSAITLVQTGTSVKGTGTKYNYTVNFGDDIDFADAASNGAMLTLEWKNGETVKAMSNIVVPKIVASKKLIANSTNYPTKSVWDTEVHVLPGDTLEIDASGYDKKVITINELNIYPGATVRIVGTNDTLSVRSLVLRNGWTRAGSKQYDVARLYVSNTSYLKKANNKDGWYSDWYIDYDQYYPIAVPFPVATSTICYKNTKQTATAGVKLRYYSGELRATNIQQNQADNWVEYTWGGTMPANLEPSKGYIMTAKRPSGKAFSIVRMPMTFSNEWTALGEKGSITVEMVTTHKDQVTVTAWGDENTPEYAKGWNIIANPYMSLHQGELSYNDASGDEIEYANIPDINFKEYDQLPIATTKLKPASAFLVQAPKDGTVTFGAANRKPSAPGYRREVQETLPKQKAYIVLNNEQSEDMMGILVSDKYSAEYEINADLEKLLGDGTSLKTYMHYGERSMAYVAINKVLAQEWIPVSVRLPQAGEYTFSLHEASRVSELEGLYLIDYTTNEITNLLVDSYTFVAEAGTISNRFAINATVGERQTPTAIDVVGVDKTGDGPIKFLYRDKVYIWHNGVIYDATGKKVKGGQK